MRATLTYLFRPENDVYRRLPAFVFAILGVGMTRFLLSVSGVDQDLTRFSSMTVVIFAATLYFASRLTTRGERLRIAYSLIAPYMLVETAGIGYTWWTGNHTIFHAIPYTFGTSIELHFWGHVIGGVTWEPLFIFVLISAFRRAFRVIRMRDQKKATG